MVTQISSGKNMISLEKKFIFIHIPKTSGNSVTEIFKKYVAFRYQKYEDKVGILRLKDRFGTWKHQKIWSIRKRIGIDTFNSYFKFSCVRDPYDRAISCYFYALTNKYGLSEEDYNRIMNGNYQFDRDYFRRVINTMFLSTPQCIWISIDKKIAVDYLIRMENLQGDCDFVCDKLNIERQNVPKINIGNHLNYKEYYKIYPEIISIVQKRYNDDFAKLNYQLNLKV